MHYLEDYLEIIEVFPEELKTRLRQVRELDERVRRQLESLEDRSMTFFTLSRSKKQEWREQQFTCLSEEYDRALTESAEKVKITTQIHELLDRYMKRLDHDVTRFTLELEADTAGITEALEQKSYHLDRPPSPERPQIGQKRRHATHQDDLLSAIGGDLHDDYSPSRSPGLPSRLPRYSRRERSNLVSLNLSSETETDLFDLDDQFISPATLYSGTGGKPPIALITSDSARSHKKKTTQQTPQSVVVAETIQDDYMGYIDPNEPRYCLCNQVSYGEMICCDSPECPIEWFHYGCVGITEAPKGKWYCPQCIASIKKRTSKKN